jgi:Kelch motif
MKTQINPGIKAHFIRGACYLLLLLGLWAIPFAQAKWNTTKAGKRSLRPVTSEISAAAEPIQKHNLSIPAGSPTPTPTCGGPVAWQPRPDQPPARYAFQAALGSDNKLYVAGGQTADMVPILYDQVSRYDYTTNTWSNVAPLPVPLSQASIGAFNGKIYIAGGYIGGSSVTNALRIYDIATNTWSSGANMPISPGVEAAAGAVWSGKFYVMGGDDFNNALNTNFIYDIATNTWTMGAPLPDSRTNTYGTAYGAAVIYVYGGVMLPGFTTTDTLLRYDVSHNVWDNLGSAGTGGRGNYGGVSGFSSGNGPIELLITDGADSMGNSTTATHLYVTTIGQFRAGPPMIGNRAGHAQGRLPDGRVLVADGFNTASTTVSTVEVLNGPPCPTPTPSPAGCSVVSTLPPCGGIIVGTPPTDFTVHVSAPAGGVQGSAFTVNGTPATSAMFLNNTTIIFHFSTSPVVEGLNTMHIPACAFPCGDPGGCVYEFTCTFTYHASTPTPTATATPTVSPIGSPTATHTPPTPTVTATATHTPTAAPTATVTVSPSPTATASETIPPIRATPIPRGRPTPVPRP